jgi:predicted ATP-dependent protease
MFRLRSRSPCTRARALRSGTAAEGRAVLDPLRREARWPGLDRASTGLKHQASAELLPDVPRESDGLFELVNPIARRALELGLASREPSFHVFVAADPQVLIEDDVVRYAVRFSEGRPPPPDVVYVHDFDHPEAPHPIMLPAGMGPALVAAMDSLIAKLQEEIPTIAEADEVKRAQAALGNELEARNKQVISDLESMAKTLGFGVRAVQGGVQTFPILHGKPVSPEQFDVLDDSTKKALADAEARLTREVEKAARLVRTQSAKSEAKRNEAFSRAAELLIVRAMDQLKEAFSPIWSAPAQGAKASPTSAGPGRRTDSAPTSTGFGPKSGAAGPSSGDPRRSVPPPSLESMTRSSGPDLAAYFDRVTKALVEDWDDLVDLDNNGEEDETGRRDSDPRDDPEHATRLSRFKVNLFVSHTPDGPSPVLYDTNPTYPNLFGYLERRARFGALLTDFSRVRAGSLHRASGGVLVVRAADVLADPIIWERMKRVLRERQIGAEDPLGPLGLYATSLRPVPVPIQVRVILVGPADLYAALLEADADFAALFRVKVEVEPTIPRTEDNMVSLDAYLMALAAERDWGEFDRGARARLLDFAVRLSGDRDKISLSLSPLEETAAFASASAAARGARDRSPAAISAEDIEEAWRDRRARAGAAERHLRELTLRGEVALDTEGYRVGVVNGLSVYSAGDVDFGQPMRITAVVALGREGIIDVEREAQLGGSIHTKGVAIVRGYLGRMFGQERPLSLRAQIAFEQSYGEIEGDSASSAELFAVLSALADVGIDQGIAVTGSVNQLGEIQAIGGLCAKVEGFFDLCAARGLSGTQGVLIPRANLPHLVLRSDVALAIEAGKFHLYAVESVAEGVDVLTGIPSGERDASGRFPASSVFGRVERRIIEIAERLREAEGHGHEGAHETLEDVSRPDLGSAARDDLDFRKG